MLKVTSFSFDEVKLIIKTTSRIITIRSKDVKPKKINKQTSRLLTKNR